MNKLVVSNITNKKEPLCLGKTTGKKLLLDNSIYLTYKAIFKQLLFKSLINVSDDIIYILDTY